MSIKNNILLLNSLKLILLTKSKNSIPVNGTTLSSANILLSLSKNVKLNVRIKSKLTMTTFKLFTNLSSYNRKHLLRIHHSYKINGLLNGSGNGGFNNVKTFYSLYSRFFNILYTLVHFNIQRLVFSNNIFREEACALNWESLSQHLFIWKYNYHSLFYKPSKLDDKLPQTFSLFKQAGITSSIVIDSSYHSKTIYYLHRAEFYSIGVTEGNKSKYLLNTTLPALGESILTQLFFVRIIAIMGRLASFR